MEKGNDTNQTMSVRGLSLKRRREEEGHAEQEQQQNKSKRARTEEEPVLFPAAAVDNDWGDDDESWQQYREGSTKEEDASSIPDDGRAQMMRDYAAWWNSRHNVKAGTAGAQAYLQRKHGGVPLDLALAAERTQVIDAARAALEDAGKRTLAQRRSAALSDLVSRYRNVKCDNGVEELGLDPRHQYRARRLVLRVGEHTACYDPIKLWTRLRINRQQEAKLASPAAPWTDPLYGVPYTPLQFRRIHGAYKRASSTCGARTTLREMTAIPEKTAMSSSSPSSWEARVTVPWSLYKEFLDTQSGAPYRVLRLSNLVTGRYTYAVATAPHHGSATEVIVPAQLLRRLGLQDEQGSRSTVLVDDCFSMPRVHSVTLQPLDPAWWKLGADTLDGLKDQLTLQIESRPILQLGDDLEVTAAGDGTFALRIVDLRGRRRERVDAAVPLAVGGSEVEVHFAV